MIQFQHRVNFFVGSGPGLGWSNCNKTCSTFQVLLKIFSYLSHREICQYALVCKKWHMISKDSRLWGFVSLRPEISKLYVTKVDHLLQVIPTKFGANLRYLELPNDLVTPTVSLAKKLDHFRRRTKIFLSNETFQLSG